MRLAAFLAKKNLSEAQFARLVEAPRSSVHKWLNGTVPSVRHMRAIYRETDGAVSPNDFYGLRRRASREGWEHLERRFRGLDEDLAGGLLSPEEHSRAVADLEGQVREIMEGGEDG